MMLRRPGTARVVTGLLTGLLLSSGCASPTPFADWTDRDIARFDEDRAATRSVPTADARGSSASDGEMALAESAPDPPDGGGRQAVETYLHRAMADNPEIRSARQKVERLRARIAQVTALPDPTASVMFGELAETAAGRVDYIVAVQQSLPFPGTLDARGEVARGEVIESLNELRVVIERVAGDVRRAYWTYLGASQEADVLGRSRDLLSQIESIVSTRLQVGAAAQADLLRLSRERASIDNRLAELDRRRRTATAMLGLAVGDPRMPPPDVDASFDWTPSSVDAEQLRRRARYQSPSVLAAQARSGTYRNRLDLARRERQPDFNFGVQYGAVNDDGLSRIANGDDQIAGMVGVSIPLWAGKYDAAEREAMRGLSESLARTRAAQDRAEYEVEAAIARIQSNEQMLERLRRSMMPDAQQTIEVALAAFRTGDVDSIQLLDDWRTLLDDQLEEARIVAELHRAAADLQQAVGDEPPGDRTMGDQ